jgi:hypothetical protein
MMISPIMKVLEVAWRIGLFFVSMRPLLRLMMVDWGTYGQAARPLKIVVWRPGKGA